MNVDLHVHVVEAFTYLGSIVATDSGAEKDIKAHLHKARSAFRKLKPYVSMIKTLVVVKRTPAKIQRSNCTTVM